MEEVSCKLELSYNSHFNSKEDTGMEFDNKKAKPDSTRKFLITQVDEQSDCCDVTVKVGQWEKRFHRCVLLKSPFFECLFKKEFKEAQTGKIEIHIGTPSSIEKALLFLYGRKPKFQIENAEIMLSLAEFLLIPSLKAACVNWLNTLKVTEENCIALLKLAGTFDIELSNCSEYAEGRLDNLLEKEDFVTIDFDSLEYILTDRRFSYVTMDEKLSFLIRWAHLNYNKRKESADVLMKHIDFTEINPELMKHLEGDSTLSAIFLARKSYHTVDKNARHDMLLIKSQTHSAKYWIFDFERNRWSQWESNATQCDKRLSFQHIAGIENSGSVIYFTDSYEREKVFCLNLETDTLQVIPVVLQENTSAAIGTKTAFTSISVKEDVCIATANHSVKRNKLQRKDQLPFDLETQMFMMSLNGLGYINQLNALHRLCNATSYTMVTDVYIGHITTECAKLNHMFTVLNEEISESCLSAYNNTLLLMTKSRGKIMLYDIWNSKLETVNEPTEYGDKVSASDDGFVVYNDKRCICIKALVGPALTATHLVQRFDFEKLESGKILFCSGRWYRYYQRDYNTPFYFEWTTYEEMLSTERKEDVKWTSLPLPIQESRCHYDTIRHPLFKIRLSRSKVQCDIECPHCKVKEQSSSVYTRRYDIGDSDYTDSSDDGDYYGGNYYYDSDYDNGYSD